MTSISLAVTPRSVPPSSMFSRTCGDTSLLSPYSASTHDLPSTSPIPCYNKFSTEDPQLASSINPLQAVQVRLNVTTENDTQKSSSSAAIARDSLMEVDPQPSLAFKQHNRMPSLSQLMASRRHHSQNDANTYNPSHQSHLGSSACDTPRSHSLSRLTLPSLQVTYYPRAAKLKY